MDVSIVQGEISSKIVTLRGQQVIMDSDLAELYQVTLKRLNEQVKRNGDRFPHDFMFQLRKEEYENLRSQFATSNKGHGGRRYMPYAFTEEGIYMLATVLNSKVAVQTNIHIIRTFKKLREFSKHYNALAKQIMEVERKSDKQYKALKIALDELIASSEVAEGKVMGFLK